MFKFKKIIEYLFYLFVFLLPWQTQWIWQIRELGGVASQYLGFSLYGTEILLLLIFFLTIVYRIKNKNSQARLANFRLVNYYLLFVVFFILTFLTSFWALDAGVTIYYLLKFLEGLALLVFIINFDFNFLKLGLAFVFSGVSQSSLAIFQFLNQNITANKWLGMAGQYPGDLGVSVVEAGGRWLRAYGSLSHPNILAGFLVVCLIVLIILLLAYVNNGRQYFYWGSFVVILTGLFFTFSKSGILSFIIALVCFFAVILIANNRQLFLVFSQMIMLFIIVFAVFSLIYQQPVLARLQNKSRLEILSVEQRLDYLKQAEVIIKKNWYGGVGLENYTLALLENDFKKQPAYVYQPVHNVFLLIIAEIGLLGLILLVMLITEILRDLGNLKVIKRLKVLNFWLHFNKLKLFYFEKENLFWLIGLVIILFVIFIIMFFDHYWWSTYFGLMLGWLCLGLFLKQIIKFK